MWPKFDLQLFGPSNNASSQNTAAQQQIQQAMQQAIASWQAYQQANPFPLNNITPPTAGPQMAPQIAGQQFGGTNYAGGMQGGQHFGGGKKFGGGHFGGQQFGGPSGTATNPLLMAILGAHANKGQGNI